MTIKVSKSDEPELRIVWGEVYAPDRPDAHGDFMREEEIRKMAHDFVRKGRMAQIDVQHENEKTDGVTVVESFIARKGDPDFLEGAWVVGVHVPDDALWAKIKKGEINGFSLEAFVIKEAQEIEVEIPPVVTGKTSKSEEHEHTFYVSYDEEGNFRGGTTDNVAGHVHKILSGTVTEEANGHSHRFSSVDVVKITP